MIPRFWHGLESGDIKYLAPVSLTSVVNCTNTCYSFLKDYLDGLPSQIQCYMFFQQNGAQLQFALTEHECLIVSSATNRFNTEVLFNDHDVIRPHTPNFLLLGPFEICCL
jgi:hypothetical protein